MLENGTFNEDDVASIRNRSIRLVLERPSPLLQYPITSWHFLLIVMTTDSVVFHWIWTGINVGNQLWVTLIIIFYPRPVFYLLWLHTVVWLLLSPARDHYVISASHSSACIRENGILHQYRSFLIQWASFGLLIKTVILLMLHSTPFALWTSPQWNRICEWSVINLSTTNKRIIFFVINLSKGVLLVISTAFKTTLKYHFPTHSLCFLDTIIPPNQHHSTEYPKPSCIDIIIISPICNWNPMAQSSSSHQHSPFVPVPYDQQPTHSDTLQFTTIEAYTYIFYSYLSLQSMVPNNTCCNSTHTVDSWHS